ncbi:MAG: aspartate aminotransferase family protein [Desulfatiglandaceae bacterium]|jgi:glutamate/tyrosine decarboxylase-like PLP-dependent enzyme
MKIPENGLSKDKILSELDGFRKNDLDWRSGRAFGYIFDPGPEVREVSKEAYSLFLTENGLDFTAFPSLLRLENELVDMARQHLNGDEQVVGNFTSGGTESIILAVKTARDYCRAHRPEIKVPEMIIPTTGHAAFHKAAHYLDVRVVQTPVDPVTFKADVTAMRNAVTSDTILLVGSAPSYAQGIVDPIREMGGLALEKDLLLHTDACMGGFMLPYFRRLGAEVPDFDFSVPGVTSLSVDLHKYAYAAKGASLVLYRNKALRKYQIFACSGWTGYTIINNAVQSSKSGGPMAAAWAVIHFLGDKGYLELARKKLEATRRVMEGIRKIPDLRLLGKPDMCLVAFASDKLNVFHLIDDMNERGWYIQPALAFDNSPQHVHMSINVSNVAWIDPFLADLEDSVKKVRNLPSNGLADGLRQALTSMDPATMTGEAFSSMLEMAGIKGKGLPKKMAEINEILNVLPPAMREALLIEYVNNLFC